ncbi:MAG: carbohydrate ABC transporter substrate-binding protein [Gammaproteobacteria bacterium]|nr:carbohydrate ABC transporter substrate-binding protein [Gammaproteobacteria bacterium]
MSGLLPLKAFLFGLYCVFSSSTAADEHTFDFWHWWISDSEVKNINLIKQHAKQQGITVQEKSMRSYNNSDYSGVLTKHIQKQHAPAAAMLISSEVHPYNSTFSLLNLDDIAQEQGWEDVIPDAIQETAKFQGHWISAPINSHSTNWLWINKALFTRLNLPIPETLNDLLVVLERAQTMGIPGLVSMTVGWEYTVLFELVAISNGGLEFYRSLFIDRQQLPGDKQLLINALMRIQQLTHYFSADTANNSWDENTAAMLQGEVLMQIQGSWVGSELENLGATADVDYLCIRFPDTQGAYLFHTDHVVFFAAPTNDTAQQKNFARMLLDKEFQRNLSISSGASPARVDTSTEGFNSCGKKSIHDLRMANMRRAVMISMNNNDMHAIMTDFIQHTISAESAAQLILEAYSPQHASAAAQGEQ